jgi:hypothetical protein
VRVQLANHPRCAGLVGAEGPRSRLGMRSYGSKVPAALTRKRTGVDTRIGRLRLNLRMVALFVGIPTKI